MRRYGRGEHVPLFTGISIGRFSHFTNGYFVDCCDRRFLFGEKLSGLAGTVTANTRFFETAKRRPQIPRQWCVDP